LLTAGDFARVQKAGRSHDFRVLVVRVARAPAESQIPFGRLGLAISKKVGNAVVRNRVKRVVREAFRLRKEAFAGYELVVIGRPEAGTLSRQAVDRIFEELLRRLAG
jgi:ribonuclease P protein component